MSRWILALVIALGGLRAYRLLASGAATIDTGVGRRVRALGPLSWDISADREIVFDVIAGPYLGRTPRALEDKLQVWERGSDMVLAAHSSAVSRRRWRRSVSSGHSASTSVSYAALFRMSWSRSSWTPRREARG
jgi:hypothetical protein